MGWLDDITDLMDMSLSSLQELVMDNDGYLKVYLFYLLPKNKCSFFLLNLRNNKDVNDLDSPLSAIIYGLNT